ncbi:unnamed protein product [Rotaria magnacalcarata]|uniref:Uncharacterized protein n=2 Tax=Rotaria magnacalcarata TaxID=392030 RepID=A0A819YSP5_9BILA|nr:unnamed protein product [Rotaria magnacalcarata]
MEIDDESSSLPTNNLVSQTQATNKRLRSDSDEQNGSNIPTVFRQNNTTNIYSSKLHMTSPNQHDFPPITVELMDKHDKTNRKLCVNCQQNHYSGHSSCPIVQQKRNEIANQQKIHRAQLLIQQQKTYEVDKMTFPSISPQLSLHSMSAHAKTSLDNSQERNRQSYALVAAPKLKNNHENVEQIIMAFANTINRQLSNMSTALISQITNLVARIDNHNHQAEKSNIKSKNR